MQDDLTADGLLFPAMGRPAKNEQPAYGRHLASLRLQSGLSQQQLADAAGVRQSNIAFWERSAKPPRGEVIPDLAKALGVSVDELLGVNGAKNDKGSHPGPASRLEKLASDLAELPRRQQTKILDVVEAMLAQQTVDASP